jgi:hypothetical protein
MTGKQSAAVARIKAAAPGAKSFHCCIHGEALVPRKTQAISKTDLAESVKVVNFIKSRATNSRLLSNFCDEIGSEHDKLLHTELRWLSRWNVLSRLLELGSEVQFCLSDTNSGLSNRFIDEMWLSRPAYLPDIFYRLNEVNNSLQGLCTAPFSVHDKINALRKNLVSLSKTKKVERCIPFHFWMVSSVKIKFN